MLKATSSIVNVSQIVGVLPVVNGGTGVTTSTGTGSTVLSAAPTLSGNVTLSTGNLIVASGQGIDFSATPGTGTSELLADYEEGTWTPTDVSGAALTFTTSAGFYTKTGRVVVATFRIIFPATANSSSANFGGLPFASKNGGSQQQQGAGLRYTDSGLNFNLANPMGSSTFQPLTNLGGVITNAAFSGKFIDAMIVYQTA